jgi:hypothetical protein
MEFLLPVALKLFPNMLPSTFEDKFAAARAPCSVSSRHQLMRVHPNRKKNPASFSA